MKTATFFLETAINNASLTEMSSEEQREVIGGDWAEAIGYSIGFAAGTFLVAGPKLITQSLAIARFLL